MDLCGCAKPENGGTLIVMGRAFPQYIGDLDKSVVSLDSVYERATK
jgi:hypothetical protein